jgi:predicted DsbA family dithiol-disulfide isomerase
VRLRQLQTDLGGRLALHWRAFPLRPTPDPTVTFKGTYREEGWRRCQALAADTGVTFRMWERPDFPTSSMPALEAAKCVLLQGEAFFGEGVNIGVPEEVAGVVRAVPGLDVARFLADYETGKGRPAVLDDYETAVREHGVRAIPTVILETGRRIVGAVSLAEYRRAIAV